MNKRSARVTVQLRIEPQLANIANEHAYSIGLDRSAYIRMILIEALRKEGKWK